MRQSKWIYRVFSINRAVCFGSKSIMINQPCPRVGMGGCVFLICVCISPEDCREQRPGIIHGHIIMGDTWFKKRQDIRYTVGICYDVICFPDKPNRQTTFKKLLCNSWNRCENPHAIVNRSCVGLNNIHARLVYLQVIKYPEHLQIILLKFQLHRISSQES